MNIIGLLRIRNEQEIIKNTLDHMANFCDFVFVYDDASTDNTVEICFNHQIVKAILRNPTWSATNRKQLEYKQRAELLHIGQQYAEHNDWFIYQDADEYIEWDFSKLKNTKAIAVRMKLFDCYITPEDVDKNYLERKYFGIEYRNIIMAFKNHPKLSYDSPDQREVHLNRAGEVLQEGYVRHYGKAVSIEQWEETCHYYSTYFPKYSKKWEARKGKAVHTVSSFGNPLIEWHEKDKGILMTKEIQETNIYENPNQ